MVAFVAEVALPVTSPVRGPAKPVAVRIPVFGIKLSLVVAVLSCALPGVDVTNVGYTGAAVERSLTIAELTEFVALIAVFAEVAFQFKGPLKLPAVTAPVTVMELKNALPDKKPVRYSQPEAFLIYTPEGSVVI